MKNQIQYPMFQPNMREIMAGSDLKWQGMIHLGPFGMPVANGRFGGPVWEENESTLVMQFNHTDAFMYHDACSQTDARGGALGQIRIHFGNPIFDGKTEHHLSLYDGILTVKTEKVTIQVRADMAKDLILLEIVDERSGKNDLRLSMEMLRERQEIRGAYKAISELKADNGLTLSQVFEEKSAFGFPENDFLCRTALHVNALNGGQQTSLLNETTAEMRLDRTDGKVTVLVGGAAAILPDGDMTAIAVANTENVKPGAIYESSERWWHEYWEKSYVILPQKPHFEKRRNYYFYLAAICNRGQHPGKYNGANWIGQGDRRDWGAWYWNWNQDSLFQPLMDANHPELMEPLFTMRKSCFKQYETAARQLWGSKGIFIGETSGVLGFETLPDKIAENLRRYYAGKEELTEETKALGESRNSFLTPWNWKLSGNRFSYVTHTMVATMETAEYFWMRYRYSRDMDFLRDEAYPFLKGAAEMYRNFWGFYKEEDGLYHFHDTNLHEHIWGGRDIIDDHALARGVFAAAEKAAALLGRDEDLQAAWQECLDHLAPYPTSRSEGAAGFASDHSHGDLVWAQGTRPAGSVRGMWGTESPQFKMLEKYDVLNMETRDQGKDHGDWEMAMRTYTRAPGRTNNLERLMEDKNGSSRFLTDVAKLGLGDDLEQMLDVQYQYFAYTPNLLRNEGDYYCAEGYGAFAAAIQTALNQSNAPCPGEEEVIRVFPAWTGKLDARYKLAAKGGFTVASSMENGHIEYVEITSTLGLPLRIRTPYEKTAVYQNGTFVKTVSGKNCLLVLETKENDVIVLLDQK